jgi:hypothetical protein
MAMPRNLQRRPAKPALGNGRIQRAVRRAFYFDFELTSSDVYDSVYPRRRHLHTRPAPCAELHAIRLLCDEKASSSLSLKPADLSALPTEQRAHLRSFLVVERETLTNDIRVVVKALEPRLVHKLPSG